jgi:hypothetical protein
MSSPTRPDSPAYRAAARRNFVIFSIAALLGVVLLVVTVTLLLV